MTPTTLHPDWQIKPFEDCLNKVIYTVKIPRKSFLKIGDFPIVSQEAKFINGYWNDKKDLFRVTSPVVIFGDHTKIFKHVDFDFVLGADGVKILSPKSFLNPMFFYYFLQSVDLKNLGYARHYRLLKQIQIPLPSLPEQKRIIKILDETFAAAERARDTAEQNLASAKELFGSYLQSVFASGGDDWEEKKLGEVCNLARGHNPPKSKFINEPKKGYVRFYQIRDGWNDNYAVYVPDTPQLHKVTPSDILMVAYRHIGRVFRGVSGAFNVALCKISNKKNGLLCDDFLMYMIPTDIIKGELMKRSERSLIPSMSIKHLNEILIPLPPLKTQKQIVAKLDQLSAETKKLEGIYQQKLDNLAELKKSILAQAFAGKL